MYHPQLGRFVSADSVVPGPTDPQMLNRYSYVRNNPMGYTDPSGHFLLPVVIGIGVAVGSMILYPKPVHAPGLDQEENERAIAASQAKVQADKDTWFNFFTGTADFAYAESTPASVVYGLMLASGTHGAVKALQKLATRQTWHKLFGKEVLDGIETGASDGLAKNLLKRIPTKFRSFTKDNYRHNLQVLTKNLGEGMDAHHIFPKADEFSQQFAEAGINVHDPRNLVWWESASHQANAAGYSAKWREFFGEGAKSAEQIRAFAKKTMGEYGF